MTGNVPLLFVLLKWADLETSGKLQRLKEGNLQGEFLVEVFGNALGYTLFPAGAAHWHLQAHFAVPGGQADGFFWNYGN